MQTTRAAVVAKVIKGADVDDESWRPPSTATVATTKCELIANVTEAIDSTTVTTPVLHGYISATITSTNPDRLYHFKYIHPDDTDDTPDIPPPLAQ